MNYLHKFIAIRFVSLLISAYILLEHVHSSPTRVDYPEIDFTARPAYIPNNVIVLTFDDGPDFRNTAKVLDALRQKNQSATFFINTKNWADVSADASMQALIRRMVSDGHELASHSVSHPHLASLSAAQIEQELAGVENTVRGVVGLTNQRITLFRAPYGEPYEENDPNNPSPGYNLVAPIVARHAVHIGWGVDSFDYNCNESDPHCVVATVQSKVGTPGNGDYGLLLMHSVHRQTAAALPTLIDYFRNNGFQFWSVEDVVRARFGLSSEQIIYGNRTITATSKPSMSIKLAINGRNGCAERKIPNSDSVCVCNATYCDDFPPIERPAKGYALVYESGKKGARFEKSTIRIEKHEFKFSTVKSKLIRLNTSLTYQSIIGFGGAFTDTTGLMLNRLPADMAFRIIEDYYSANGLEYSLSRIPIGGTDFSPEPYSYDDVSGDLNLTHWSLRSEDYECKLPYARLAQRISPRGVKFFGSPWSPPSWMKTNGKFNESGKLFGEPGGEYYQSWANHFVKFLDAYRTNGVEMWGLTVENEPIEGQKMSQINTLNLDAPLERDFVKLNLGPALDRAGYGPDRLRLMIYDENVYQLQNWTDTILGDREAAKYVSGVAFHWYSNSKTDEYPAALLDSIHAAHPNYFLLSTEACHLSDAGNGRWDYGENYARDIIRDLNHWVIGWVDWNLALNTSGGPHWNSNASLSSPILVNVTAREYYKQPMFYALGHFSKFITPDSRRIGVREEGGDDSVWVTAVLRPDMGVVVVALNLNEFDVELAIVIDDREENVFNKLPARSIQSYIWWT